MVKVLDSNNQHVWKCLECGKISKYITNLKGHVEANHFQGLQFNCSLCAKVFKSRGSLRNHISNIHKEKHGLAPFPLVWLLFVFSCFWANKDLHGHCIWWRRQKSGCLHILWTQVEVCNEYTKPHRRKAHGRIGLQVPLLWLLGQYLANCAAAHETHPQLSDFLPTAS